MAKRIVTACILNGNLAYESRFQVEISTARAALLRGSNRQLFQYRADFDGRPIYIYGLPQAAVARAFQHVTRENFSSLGVLLCAVREMDKDGWQYLCELALCLNCYVSVERRVRQAEEEAEEDDDLETIHDVLSVRAVFAENPALIKGREVSADISITEYVVHIPRETIERADTVMASREQLQALPDWFRRLVAHHEAQIRSITYPEAIRYLGHNPALLILWIAISCNDFGNLAHTLEVAGSGDRPFVYAKMECTEDTSTYSQRIRFVLTTTKEERYGPEEEVGALLARIDKVTGASVKPVVRANFHRRLRTSKQHNPTDEAEQ